MIADSVRAIPDNNIIILPGNYPKITCKVGGETIDIQYLSIVKPLYLKLLYVYGETWDGARVCLVLVRIQPQFVADVCCDGTVNLEIFCLSLILCPVSFAKCDMLYLEKASVLLLLLSLSTNIAPALESQFPCGLCGKPVLTRTRLCAVIVVGSIQRMNMISLFRTHPVIYEMSLCCSPYYEPCWLLALYSTL